MYMYKEDLALNNLQWLICHKTKPNQLKVLLKKNHSCKSLGSIKRMRQGVSSATRPERQPTQKEPKIISRTCNKECQAK